MKIKFYLTWSNKGKITARAFKMKAAHEMMQEYCNRIGHFHSCEMVGGLPTEAGKAHIWLCDTAPKTKLLSSADLAQKVNRTLQSGASEWHIVIGDSDGFSEEDKTSLNPQYLWCFGPATYPHELAAVIASEQVYRSFAILNNLPYHCGH